MPLSRTGLIFCLIYLLFSGAVWAVAYLSTGDPKTAFLLMQAPVIFVHALYVKMGLLDAMAKLPGYVAYAALFIPNFAALYLIGWFLGWFFSDPIGRK